MTVFPMNRVSAAHKHIESGLSIGKLVLNTKQVGVRVVFAVKARKIYKVSKIRCRNYCKLSFA